MSDKFYIPLKVVPFSDLEVIGGEKIDIIMEDDVLGFMPVYQDLAKLKTDYPGVDHLTLNSRMVDASKALQEEPRRQAFIRLKREQEAEEMKEEPAQSIHTPRQSESDEADKLAEQLIARKRSRKNAKK